MIKTSQCGFIKNKSTEMVASDFTNEILRSFDGRTFVIGAYLSKALSPIVFCCLKLEHNSVRGSSLTWFTSYLTNRKHYIYIIRTVILSTLFPLGVPQGSILGPSTFVYMNVMVNTSSLNICLCWWCMLLFFRKFDFGFNKCDL